MADVGVPESGTLDLWCLYMIRPRWPPRKGVEDTARIVNRTGILCWRENSQAATSILLAVLLLLKLIKKQRNAKIQVKIYRSISCGSAGAFAHGKVWLCPRGVHVLCVTYKKKNSESTHGKSLGIHQREQKNNPWHSRSQVVWFICGLSNHKSSSTNRVEENCKYRKPQHMLRWIRGRYPVTYLIQDTRRQAWRTFEVHSEYILHVFAPNTLIIWVPLVRHGFVIVFFFVFWQ